MKPNTPHKPLPASAGEDAVARLDKLRNAKGSLRTAEVRRNMQKVMQNNAAVFRTQDTLAEGCKLIDECAASFQDVKVGAGRPAGRAVWFHVVAVGAESPGPRGPGVGRGLAPCTLRVSSGDGAEIIASEGMSYQRRTAAPYSLSEEILFVSVVVSRRRRIVSRSAAAASLLCSLPPADHGPRPDLEHGPG
jgi:hypothetical protein